MIVIGSDRGFRRYQFRQVTAPLNPTPCLEEFGTLNGDSVLRTLPADSMKTLIRDHSAIA